MINLIQIKKCIPAIALAILLNVLFLSSCSLSININSKESIKNDNDISNTNDNVIIQVPTISAEKMIAKNLNTVLAVGDTPPNSVDDLFAVLHESGFTPDTLNTKKEGLVFVWESETNQILLVNTNEDFKVEYFNSEYAPIGETWHIFVTDLQAANVVQSKIKGINAHIHCLNEISLGLS